MRALVDAGAIGLVTTHDLALTELASTLGTARGERALRGSARGRQDGVRLPDAAGVVEHSNALALMRAVGLDV